MPVIKQASAKPKIKPIKSLGIKAFRGKRNKVLIRRNYGGLGDILMHRMMFEDFKLLAPDIELTFACPKQLMSAVIDHPFIDHVVDVESIDVDDYMVYYDTSRACMRYELAIAPLADKHRSDIWANHCGVDLTKHNMHIRLTEEEKTFGRILVESFRDAKGPSVLICPVSSSKSKDLTTEQLAGITAELKKLGCYVLGLHDNAIPYFIENNVPIIQGVTIREWMSVINAVDYVISVDTAQFHCAGGMGKPTVGVYAWADGQVYGKYHSRFELCQKHRNLDPNWTCGPCYNWGKCPKSTSAVKPCLTEITIDMIMSATLKLFERFPING